MPHMGDPGALQALQRLCLVQAIFGRPRPCALCAKVSRLGSGTLPNPAVKCHVQTGHHGPVSASVLAGPAADLNPAHMPPGVRRSTMHSTSDPYSPDKIPYSVG